MTRPSVPTGPVVAALAAAAMLLALAPAACAAPTSPPTPPPPAAPAVTGYALPGARAALVRREAHALSTLTVAASSLSADGRRARRPGADALGVAAAGRAAGLRTELLLSNYSDRLGDFDTRAVGRLLEHPGRVRAVAARVASYAVDGGWDGVNVDLEAMRARHAPGLVLLVRELRAAMPAALSVSVDVSASTSLAGYRRRGYRLGALGRSADLLQLMTSDQHGPGWSGPGPIGASGWQRRALDTALTRVPAARLDVGVAGYGYAWTRAGSRRPGFTVTVARARALVAADGARAVWLRGPGEWRATLADGTRLRWSDGRSVARRVELAADLGLHGVALWRLGSADPLGAGAGALQGS